MRIPNSFKLFGHTVEIVKLKDLLHTDGVYGDANHRAKRIRLHVGGENAELPTAAIEQAYLHEVLHIILNEMNEGELCGNEKFVDVLASLLHQALTTGEADA